MDVGGRLDKWGMGEGGEIGQGWMGGVQCYGLDYVLPQSIP